MEKVKTGKYSMVGDEWNIISNEAKIMMGRML